MEISDWVTIILTGAGTSAIVTSYLNFKFKTREAKFQSRHNELEKRYRVIILLMYAAYNFEDNKSFLRIQRPDLKTQSDVLDDLKAECFNMLLFASKTTQTSLHCFITEPNLPNLLKTANSMRQDLGLDDLGENLNYLKF